MPLRTLRPERSASAIPPLRHGGAGIKWVELLNRPSVSPFSPIDLVEDNCSNKVHSLQLLSEQVAFKSWFIFYKNARKLLKCALN